jgi:TonB family protein
MMAQNGGDMIQKNLLITAIVISLVGHMAIIAISGMIVFNSPGSAEKPFTVHLESKATSIGSKPAFIKSPTEQDHPIPEGTQGKGEAVVELGDRQTKYYSYLKHLKRKFEQQWTYPRDAYSKKEKGASVVRFSIGESGNLADAFILSSSGHESLDGEALRVIHSSCPFDPLPANFNLSMLHVIARFQYNLAE